ncbi:hypothetical protein ADUPG1_010920 [Aduncisulcus paluster]|uniref:Uncharacterized protein n=1 Tax=Aduncisulcus paluster TaxID=2918883 RepID=A0ABQ5JVI0_9EUKA|nr:hypothetical protein ADUPG1_010920 [Aduncisulcus paluster]
MSIIAQHAPVHIPCPDSTMGIDADDDVVSPSAPKPVILGYDSFRRIKGPPINIVSSLPTCPTPTLYPMYLNPQTPYNGAFIPSIDSIEYKSILTDLWKKKISFELFNKHITRRLEAVYGGGEKFHPETPEQIDIRKQLASASASLTIHIIITVIAFIISIIAIVLSSSNVGVIFLVVSLIYAIVALTIASKRKSSVHNYCVHNPIALCNYIQMHCCHINTRIMRRGMFLMVHPACYCQNVPTNDPSFILMLVYVQINPQPPLIGFFEPDKLMDNPTQLIQVANECADKLVPVDGGIAKSHVFEAPEAIIANAQRVGAGIALSALK